MPQTTPSPAKSKRHPPVDQRRHDPTEHLDLARRRFRALPGDPRDQQGPNQRRQSAHQPGRHPHRPLGQSALVEREPVVQGPGEVRIGPGLAHPEQKLQEAQEPEAPKM